jgi:ribonuclease HI
MVHRVATGAGWLWYCDDECNAPKEISEGYRYTTNNRMELLSVIVALETLKKENTIVTVYSDSKYVVDAIEKKWVFGWEKKNFAGKKNPDLWQRF